MCVCACVCVYVCLCVSVCVCQGSLSLCRCGRWIGGGCGQEDGQPHFCAASGRPLTLKVQIKKKKRWRRYNNSRHSHDVRSVIFVSIAKNKHCLFPCTWKSARKLWVGTTEVGTDCEGSLCAADIRGDGDYCFMGWCRCRTTSSLRPFRPSCTTCTSYTRQQTERTDETK